MDHPEDKYLTLVPNEFNDFSDELLQREIKERNKEKVNIFA